MSPSIFFSLSRFLDFFAATERMSKSFDGGIKTAESDAFREILPPIAG